MTDQNPKQPFETTPKQARGCGIFAIAFMVIAVIATLLGNTEEDTPAATDVSEPATQAAPAEASQIPAAAAPAQESAVTAEETELQESDFDAEALAARKRMAARADEVKPELLALFNEFEAMRQTSQFKELGFSAKNPVGSDWYARVEAARTKLEADTVLPLEVKVVPSYLLGYAVSFTGNKTPSASDLKWDLEMIQNGLNWQWND